jgi:hypothetical protein
MYDKFPANLRTLPMVVFRSWQAEQVPLHTFDDRLDMIASGGTSKVCRYGPKEMEALN